MGLCCSLNRNPFPLEGDTIESICLMVFNRLKSDDAVNDLSLPCLNVLNTLDFQLVFSRIQFHFEIQSDGSRLRSSYTRQARNTTALTHCYVYYYKFEVKDRPELIKARVLHEATHAIRGELVLYFRNDDSVPLGSKKLATPDQKVADRLFSTEPLYMLENSKFHSGYYMEHALNGGVWVVLYGDIVNPDTHQVTSLPARGVPFKVINKTGNRQTVGLSDFIELSGYFKGSVEPELVLHCGEKSCGSDAHENCSHAVDSSIA